MIQQVKDIENNVANIEYYVKKVRESIDKEFITADNYEEVKHIKQATDTIAEMCHYIYLNLNDDGEIPF
jgi:hypothetical protein